MLRIWSLRWRRCRIRAPPPSPPSTKRLSSKRWIWLAAAGIAVAVVAALVWWRRQPPAVPVVEAVTQLTDDHEPKRSHNSLATDGSRVYFNEGTAGSLKIAQVAVTGGPTAIIPTRFPIPHLAGLNREGSSLLVVSGNTRAWPCPYGQYRCPRENRDALAASKLKMGALPPDGRILFSLGKDLFMADNDGSNPRKLFSADGLIRGAQVFLQTTSGWFSRLFAVGLQFPRVIQYRRFGTASRRERQRRKACVLWPMDPGQ